MTQVTDAVPNKADEDFIDDLCEMKWTGGAYNQYQEHELNYRQRVQKTAEYREAAVREALDQQARRVFAALCGDCREGKPVALKPNFSSEWSHAADSLGAYPCKASAMRKLLDPDRVEAQAMTQPQDREPPLKPHVPGPFCNVVRIKCLKCGRHISSCVTHQQNTAQNSCRCGYGYSQ